MLSSRETFKFGFLLKCAEAGLTAAQAQDVASAILEKQAGPGFDALKFLGITLPVTGAGLALGGAGLTGMGGGYLAAKMTENDTDPEEAKKRELIQAYRQQADYAKRMGRRTLYRAAQNRPGLRAPSLLH